MLDLISTLPLYVHLFVVVLLIFLAILWFVLPFAIFGTKDKLSTLISETRDANMVLKTIASELVKLNQRLAVDTQRRPVP